MKDVVSLQNLGRKHRKNGRLPSGYDCYIALVFRWPIEIDGLPINSMVIFHGYVK